MEKKQYIRQYDFFFADQFLISPSGEYTAKTRIDTENSEGPKYYIDVIKKNDNSTDSDKTNWSAVIDLAPSGHLLKYTFIYLHYFQLKVVGTDDEGLYFKIREIAENCDNRDAFLDFFDSDTFKSLPLLGVFTLIDSFGGLDRSLQQSINLLDDGSLLYSETDPELRERHIWNSLVKLAPPEGIENLTSDQKTLIRDTQSDWLREVDYENMKFTESRIIIGLGEGKYKRIDDVSTIINGFTGIKVTKNFLGPSFSFVVKGSVMDSATPDGTPSIAAVDLSILSAEAHAECSSFFWGAGAGISLIEADASIFKLKLGLGVDTGIGIKDDSIEVKLAGTGVTVGRVLSISVFNNSFGIDFGRLISIF